MKQLLLLISGLLLAIHPGTPWTPGGDAQAQFVIPDGDGGSDETDTPKEKEDDDEDDKPRRRPRKKACTDKSEYQQLMTEGRMSAKYKDYPAAITKFEEAQAVCPVDPVATYELARAQQLAGKCEVAEALYKQSLSLLAAADDSDLDRAEVEKAMADNAATCGSAVVSTDCPTGSTWSEGENKCIFDGVPECPPNSSWSSEQARCIASVGPDCPSGATWSDADGKCIAQGEPDCPTGSRWNASEGRCVGSAPANVAGQTGGGGGGNTTSKKVETAIPSEFVMAFGVMGKGGIGSADGTNSGTGIGGGGQIYAMLKLADGSFYVGLDVDVLFTAHDDTAGAVEPTATQGTEGTTTMLAPSVGLKVRFDLSSDIVVAAFANFLFGWNTISFEDEFADDISIFLTGAAIGADLIWSFPITASAALDAGIYLHYNYLSGEFDDGFGFTEDVDSNYINVGASLGLIFDVGL